MCWPFCCCKRKKKIYSNDLDKNFITLNINDSEEDIEKNNSLIKPDIEHKKLDIEYKKDVLLMCISEHPRFRCLTDDIEEFSNEEIGWLFEADYEKSFPFRKVTQKYFSDLLVRIDSYQGLFQKWYRDESKYEYIKKIFLSKYDMNDFIKKEEELENVLDDIFNNDEIAKTEFDDIKFNSPEFKADKIHNKLKVGNPSFLSLIEVSIENCNKIEESLSCEDHEKDSLNKINPTYFEKAKDIFNKLTSISIKDIAKGLFPKDWDKNISKIIEIVRQKFQNSHINKYGIKPETILKLAEKLKGNFFLDLTKDVTIYFSEPTVAVSRIALSFLNLCESITSFKNSNCYYKGKIEEFHKRLGEIQKDFEEHIKEISYLIIEKDYDLFNAESLLLKIGENVIEDRKKLKKLINEIQDEINGVKKKNRKNAAQITVSVFGAVGCTVASVLTGGALGIFYLVGSAANITAMGLKSREYVKNKDYLKNFNKSLDDANKLHKDISEKIEELKSEYNKI